MKREVLLAPKPLASSEASSLLALKLGYILINVSTRFLKDAAFKNDVVQITDRHVEDLWRRMLTSSATTLVAHGRDRLKKEPYVYMSNHLSLFDIPVLFGVLPPSMRMVAKSELLKIPIFGKALEQAGFIIIDRHNRTKAVAQLEKAKEHLRNGVSVWIAPEGTRKRDKNIKLQDFKKGGFHTALSLEVPIVPVWIEGSDRVMPADKSVVYPNQTVDVYFGEPIPTKGRAKENIAELMHTVREAMLELAPQKSRSAKMSNGD